ncbi:ImmA/IrrE family metallo-endopeptidase [Xanthomonas melonis]|uniref:ImmA/IrrE family metallo-endopeptidase n=1 Tax=Xanthomonas melonis TaxID=56456 RepID=UPI001E32F7A3|nr:ImmA/IrrE family metallo-endopeptidase [Xanthomonas melonis]MCD0279375.1 ImmA/IrrE family metallo-endopeptidase [Xanthomonas melonis]
MNDALTASRAAFKFTHVLDLFSQVHGTARFPIDVVALAKDAANHFGWKDPITQVEAADIQRFEGALFANDERSKWCLLYNSAMKSAGRIRFTQAHELGHYVLHRSQQSTFNCSEDDVVNRDTDEATIEAQADTFAATLLMPLNDFRSQMDGSADFEGLSACADRYGVSLTAATLRWLKSTDRQAVLVVHRDGYIRWAFSSKAAAKNGAFFRSRKQLIEIPERSMAADSSISVDRAGGEVPATVWFPHAHSDLSLREMKVTASEYDTVMSLLVLPRGASVWKPSDEIEL